MSPAPSPSFLTGPAIGPSKATAQSSGRKAARQRAAALVNMAPSAGMPATPGQVLPGSAEAASKAASAESTDGGILADEGTPTLEEQAEAEAKAAENAVTQRLVKTKMCYFFERGKCASQTCRYAHSESELRKQPNLQKTKLCKSYAETGVCTEGENCVFAHGETELRVTEGIYKTQMCHFFERGRCLKGERCNHAHGPQDLRVLPARNRSGSGGSQGRTEGSSGVPWAPPKDHSSYGRSPLSPLPLSELLSESAHPQAALTAPAPPPVSMDPLAAAAVAGAAFAASAHHLMTPDLSGSNFASLPARPWGFAPANFAALANSPMPRMNGTSWGGAASMAHDSLVSPLAHLGNSSTVTPAAAYSTVGYGATPTPYYQPPAPDTRPKEKEDML
eukprot:TRINITY_DN19993_c0_g1_i1.p1 TRINITY_DN19993_c0_g1~~TRINITY_DN19993_c0_g1_i1.p1  ORF type:complete len:391 (-),score=78.68 TRINITY_DN19993_c0_g1_i1:17-1189(-)